MKKRFTQERIIGLRWRIEGGWALPALLALLLYFPSNVAAEPRVLVLNEANAPPYTNPDRTGFFDVVATEAFRRAHLELRLQKLPAERALLLSNSGISAGELNRLAGVEAQYPNLVRVPEKLGDWYFAAFSKDASVPGRIDAIRGRTVGLIRGWKIYELALAGAKDVIAVDDPEQLFRMLQLGRIDVALYERSMGLALIKERGIQGVLVIEPALFVRETFIYLHRSYAGELPALTAALRAMKGDGSYQRAYDEKLLPYFSRSLP
ncbi:MAG: transporter substrate-binding domain-containing protein [Betaproteobacteria bacterium]|nr:MAG: transporter substrate-binding domain-containing protein [Betaproteobacteria bacterium]